jgi:hypothetical protein
MAEVIHAAGVLRIGLGSLRRGVGEVGLTALRVDGEVSAIRCRSSGRKGFVMMTARAVVPGAVGVADGTGSRRGDQSQRQHGDEQSGNPGLSRRVCHRVRFICSCKKICPLHVETSRRPDPRPMVQNRGAKSGPRCECAMNAALRSSSDAVWLNGSNHAAGLGVHNRKVRSNDHQADSRRGCPGRGCARHSGICRAACGSSVDVDRGPRRPTSPHAWAPAPSLAPLSPLPRGLPRLLA